MITDHYPTSEQEAFDIAWGHFVTEGHGPSVGRNPHQDSSIANVCRYRGDGGNACAIGVLIPEDSYDPALEGSSLGVLFETDGTFSLCEAIVPLSGLDRVFLMELQDCHDQAYSHSGLGSDVNVFRTQVRQSLEKLAKDWELKVPIAVAV